MTQFSTTGASNIEHLIGEEVARIKFRGDLDSGHIVWSCGCECAFYRTYEGTETNDLFCQYPKNQCERILDRELAKRGA